MGVVNKRTYEGHPIDPTTARITMITFGIILILVGFFVNRLAIIVGSEAVTHLVIGTILIISAVVIFVELGLKRFSDWSKLRSFENQQVITFIVGMIVLISGILNFFQLGHLIDFFNAGSIVTSGAFIILEALR